MPTTRSRTSQEPDDTGDRDLKRTRAALRDDISDSTVALPTCHLPQQSYSTNAVAPEPSIHPHERPLTPRPLVTHTSGPAEPAGLSIMRGCLTGLI
jgi:hypothetical protein